MDSALSNEAQMALLRKLMPTARTRAQGSGQGLATELAALAGIDLTILARQVEAGFGIRFLDVHALSAPPDWRHVTVSDCERRMIYPLARNRGTLFVVTDPWDDMTLQWLANRTNHYPDLAWATRETISTALRRHTDTAAPSSSRADQDEAGTTSLGMESTMRSSSPVVRFVDAAIFDAWEAGASDIHFECGADGIRVKLRLDGVLVPATELADRILAEEAISRIKVLAQLDIAEQRIPQDGRFRLRIGGHDLDFRVSIMPSIHGEDAVVRLLDKGSLRTNDADITLSSLGLDPDAIARIRRLARRPHGMLLVTGPTGSGKTTTLYATLSEIKTGQEKIITIEDPVEYGLPGILQIPVNDKKGLTFSQGLRSILRHDPDKILVGEIRDAETADIAVQAALTGHLVFTTVHANSVFDVIGRFIHMNIDLYSFLSALSGVVAQRLLRCVCRACAQPSAPSELAARLATLEITDTVLAPLEARGCDECRHTGYKGRVAIAEVLTLDDKLRALILARADISDIKRYVRELGVRPLIARALLLVADGVTTLEEIDRAVAHD